MTSQLTVRPFDHAPGEPQYTGNRGVVIEADTRFVDSRHGVFSRWFPSVFVSDSGDVSVDEMLLPATDYVSWLREVADAIEARLEQQAARAAHKASDDKATP